MPDLTSTPPSALPSPLPGKSIDPVCSMTVDEAAPKGGTADYKGERYYFCNVNCNKKFTADPEGILDSYRKSLENPAPGELETPAVPPGKNLSSLVLDIGGMSCASCAATIERSLRKTAGVTKANVNFAAQRAFVSFDPEVSNPAALKEAVKKSGYEVREKKSKPGEEDRLLLARMKVKLAVAWLFALPLLVVAMAFMWGNRFSIPHHTELYLELALCTPIIIAGYEFYRVGVKALLNRSPNMDSL